MTQGRPKTNCRPQIQRRSKSTFALRHSLALKHALAFISKYTLILRHNPRPKTHSHSKHILGFRQTLALHTPSPKDTTSPYTHPRPNTHSRPNLRSGTFFFKIKILISVLNRRRYFILFQQWFVWLKKNENKHTIFITRKKEGNKQRNTLPPAFKWKPRMIQKEDEIGIRKPNERFT